MDAGGGVVTSPDGRLTVTVPAGALNVPVEVALDQITDTAPGRIDGVAYRLGPADAIVALPLAFVFQAAPPGTGLDTYSVAYQENQGFWLRQREVQRSVLDGTLTVSSGHFGDWSIVTGSPDDLHGLVTVQSTIGVPFSASGIVTLNAAGGDESGNYYLQWGTLTLDSAQLTSGAAVCTANPVSVDLDANIAEVMTPLEELRWGMTARWPLTCTDGGGPTYSDLASLLFDTMGIYRGSCTRGYTQGPVITATEVQGSYTIDCGTDGVVTTTWDMLTCTPGQSCSLICHNAVTSCDSGFAVCVDSGLVADGTACGSSGTGTCSAGICSAP